MSQTVGSAIRLALLDDQTLFREGLAALLEREPDLETIAQAATVQTLTDLAVEPQVIITGLALPDARCSVVVERLKARFLDSAYRGAHRRRRSGDGPAGAPGRRRRLRAEVGHRRRSVRRHPYGGSRRLVPAALDRHRVRVAARPTSSGIRPSGG